MPKERIFGISDEMLYLHILDKRINHMTTHCGNKIVFGEGGTKNMETI